VAIARSGGVARYPARFQLVMAANPCPCAAPAGAAECRCTSTARRRYIGPISGPLLDRMDLQVQLEPVAPGGAAGRARHGRIVRGGGVPGGRGPGGGGRAAARHRLADQRRCARTRAAQPVAAAGGSDRGGRRPPRPRRAERARLRRGASGRVVATSPGRPALHDRRRGGPCLRSHWSTRCGWPGRRWRGPWPGCPVRLSTVHVTGTVGHWRADVPLGHAEPEIFTEVVLGRSIRSSGFDRGLWIEHRSSTEGPLRVSRSR
jgi:Magnesium chelatase, subunit ChlI